MAFKRSEWPEVGDLVLATVQRITNYGAYVTLDEYNKEGLLHITEVASSWIRNIRDHVREGQKVVLKVLRVDTEKGHVDLSLRRVTKRERIEKVLSFKKERKAESLFRSASERLNMPLPQLYEKVGVLIEKEFGGLHEGLERVARDDAEVLLKLGIPQDIATVLEQIAKEKIHISMVKVKGIFQLQCTKPNGVNIIRDSLLSAQKVERHNGIKIRIYVVTPPKYRIEVLAEDYKKAEQALQSATEIVLKNIKKSGGQGFFEREK